MRSQIGVLACCLGLLLLVGCGGGVESLDLYPVKGKVTKGGEPLGDISVTLLPKGESEAPGLLATTSADGTFEVVTGTGEKGAPVGTYAVILNDHATQIDYSNPKAGPAKSDRIPEKYTSERTTDAVLEVTADGENTIEIDVSR